MGLMLTIYLLGCSASVGSHTEGRESVSSGICFVVRGCGCMITKNQMPYWISLTSFKTNLPTSIYLITF